jgi:WD40 repeat protein
LAWSPDGKEIASTSSDKTVQIWDATTGVHRFTYTGHSEKTGIVDWSPDGTRIASNSDDLTVQVWSAG